MFSSIAGTYDPINTLLSFNMDRYWRRFTVSKLDPEGSELALDVATGTGKLAQELAKKLGEGGKVVGIDYCEAMLRKAKKRKNIEFVPAISENLPFPDSTFDYATIGFGLRNVTDLEKTLWEMARVIKPEGKIACLEFSLPRSRLFQNLHHIYLFKVMPFIGGLISGNKKAYNYFPRSIEEFLKPEELRKIMEGVGLKDVQFFPLTRGTVTIHLGTKI